MKKKPTKKKSSQKKKETSVISKEWSDDLIKSLVDKENEIIRTEDALVEAMKRFRDIFEQSPIGVAMHDPKGEILVVNSAYMGILGIDTFSDIRHHNLFEDKQFTAKNKKLIKEGKTVQCEKKYDFDKIEFAVKREGIGYVLLTGSPIFREKDIVGYMVQVQDITERKKIDESQRLAQLGRLLSDMAHEINNPLMIISGRVELLLLSGIKDKEMESALKVILEQCFFAKDIIQRLLRYSRLGNVEKRALDIEAILEGILAILNHHFKMTNIEIKKDIKKGLPEIMGHEKQLQEVFINILRNATEAMSDDGVITIRISEHKTMIKIEIEDDGEGMSGKIIARIFEPFFTTKQEGTGLGMAVCRTIIQEHGGRLDYKSKVGVGTTATMLLPVEKKAK